MKTFISSTISRVVESSDFMKFLWKSKMWFMMPIVIILLLLGVLFFLVQASGVAPFIYPLF